MNLKVIMLSERSLTQIHTHDIPFIGILDNANSRVAVARGWGGQGLAALKQEKTCRVNGNILCLDYGGGSMGIYLSDPLTP